MGRRDDAQLYLRCRRELRDRLTAAANDRDVPLNWLAVKLLEEGLANLKPGLELTVAPIPPVCTCLAVLDGSTHLPSCPAAAHVAGRTWAVGSGGGAFDGKRRAAPPT